MATANTCGLVLAAGAGTRFGGPKALARADDGTPWLALAVAALRAGGCGEVIVVLGAGADAAVSLVPDGVRVVVAEDWAEGLSRSLRAGLAAASALEPRPTAAVVVPVDAPELPAAAVARVIGAGDGRDDALARASYGGAPGHPALLGAAHWTAIAAEVRGDAGAGGYLSRHGAEGVECADLWSGDDRDR